MVYEVKSGGGAIQLVTLKPEELSVEKIKKFVDVIRVEIPTMMYVGCICMIVCSYKFVMYVYVAL